jgi:hypothetical protein
MAASVETLAHLKPESRVSDFASDRDGLHFVALLAMAAGALVLGIVVLAIRWNAPLIGMHSFRQTQTAITSYYFLKGGPWLAYQTPVLGAPWSIPFEFPIYQLLVAGFVKLTGLSLDTAGRVVSYLFLVLTIWPVRSIARSYRLDDRSVLVFAILFLSSPIYLYWGTTFLMETLVVFFCFAFLAGVARTIESGDWRAVVVGTICGVLGALGKITTFAPFYLLVGLMLLHQFVARMREGKPLARTLISNILVMLPAPLLFTIWDRFADAQKAKNPIGRLMISTTVFMRRWNFGTWDQLFSKHLILTVFRATTDTLGVATILILLSLAIAGRYYRVFDRRVTILVSASLAGFLSPYFLFTNLHIVHNYYDTANAICLICTVSLIIGALFAKQCWRTGWSLLLVTVISQLLWFQMLFARDLYRFDNYQLAIARSIKANTHSTSVIAIYGQDWSSVIPYYSERRAIMESSFEPRADIFDRLRHLLSPQGGYPVEAIVRCPSAFDADTQFAQTFVAAVATLRKQRIGKCDVYFTRPVHD